MDDLTAKIPQWEREAQEHERKAHALRQIIEGVRALNGDAGRLFGLTAATTATNHHPTMIGPRGRTAIRQILTERPGVWKVADMKAEIQRRGWPFSASGTEVAMRRLAEAGELEKLSQGVYRFGPDRTWADEQAPTPEESTC